MNGISQTLKQDMAKTTLEDKRVSILGTGNFGAALGKRLLQYGYDVTYGSRRPETRDMASIDPSLAQANVLDIGDAIKKSGVIIFAVRVASFKAIAERYSTLLAGKVVIDVSNKSKDVKLANSNAEFLQSLLPESTVVKAFNVISAYTLESEFDDSSRVVPIASDDDVAKDVVSKLVTSLGFSPKDAGKLSAAKGIETSVLSVLPMWKFPVLLALAIYSLSWLYVIYMYYIRIDHVGWEFLFVRINNKPLAFTSLNLFALTYLPGCLAALLQLYNGTKYKRFPRWLDYWMKCRKQLGLVAFAFAAIHMMLSVLLFGPNAFTAWYERTEMTIPVNQTEDISFKLPSWAPLTWVGGIVCLTGALSLFVFAILALTSLPSVGQTLNWAEWRFVQSKLGYVGLFFGFAHAYFVGMPGWVKRSVTFMELLRSVAFMSIILTGMVLITKVLLLLPCVSGRLRKIRRGWERSSTGDKVGDIEIACIKP